MIVSVAEIIDILFRCWSHAYLDDLPAKRQAGTKMQRGAFRRSEWFRRGWTLQELLAPKDVIFCDREWNLYGSRFDLASSIAATTGIDEAFLNGIYEPRQASVAMRMSWASTRSTTRSEDIAYCLLGIFDVSMPPIYGEKEEAFARLQHKIIRSSDDESIFAWKSEIISGGILAKSPHDFKDARRIVNIRLKPVERLPYFIADKGLQIRSASDTQAEINADCSTGQPMGYDYHVLELGGFIGSIGALTAEDSDVEQSWEDGALTIELRRYGPTWQRVNCHRLGRASNASRPKRLNGTYSGR